MPVTHSHGFVKLPKNPILTTLMRKEVNLLTSNLRFIINIFPFPSETKVRTVCQRMEEASYITREMIVVVLSEVVCVTKISARTIEYKVTQL